MTARPQATEAAPYYFVYIDQVAGEDVCTILGKQLDEVLPLFTGISAEKSLYRYAADKWSIRQVLNHLSDCERLFTFRALWFARGFAPPLPSFDQHIAVAGALADGVAWAEHIEEFRRVRWATLSFFRNLPEEAWSRRGIASDNPFTVRALAYIVAGHVEHHVRILRQRYLQGGLGNE